MSSQSCFELLRLAPEVVENIIRQVGDKTDLCNTRLACSTLNQHAIKELFKNVFISPHDRDISKWNSISQDDVIRHIPRHAIMHTHSDIEGWGEQREYENIDEEDESDFCHAVVALNYFPNLGTSFPRPTYMHTKAASKHHVLRYAETTNQSSVPALS